MFSGPTLVHPGSPWDLNVSLSGRISSALKTLDWEEGKWAMTPEDSEGVGVTVVGAAQPGSEWLNAEAGPVPTTQLSGVSPGGGKAETITRYLIRKAGCSFVSACDKWTNGHECMFLVYTSEHMQAGAGVYESVSTPRSAAISGRAPKMETLLPPLPQVPVT